MNESTSPVFSIVVPAFDEEKYLPKCIAAIRRAESVLGEAVEIVVGDNMSTDRTREVARELGAVVVEVPEKCISTVRNRATAISTGKYLVYIDADDCMSENALVEIKRVLDSGKYAGGGCVNLKSDRWSLGIFLTGFLLILPVPFSGVSLFLFYTTRETFDAIGGWNEQLKASEDWDFGYRLKRHGKKIGQKYYHLWRASITKSARKFDEFGDWFVFTRPLQMWRAIHNDEKATYEIWYKPRR
jgi:glycosyltransferase involved in cell wall biosynthesis